MRASLADQGGLQIDTTLAIGLGANLPSPAGGPVHTLVAVRPRLERLLAHWLHQTMPEVGQVGALRWHWSPLFETAPLGGPPDQPAYCNALLLLELPAGWCASLPMAAAPQLLVGLQQLEQAFGRQRLERWGPRSLDLDLLWVGGMRLQEPGLVLPHPRLLERAFVLAPLLAIAPQFLFRGLDPAGRSGAALLHRMLAEDPGQSVHRIPAVDGWPEG